MCFSVFSGEGSQGKKIRKRKGGGSHWGNQERGRRPRLSAKALARESRRPHSEWKRGNFKRIKPEELEGSNQGDMKKRNLLHSTEANGSRFQEHRENVLHLIRGKKERENRREGGTRFWKKKEPAKKSAERVREPPSCEKKANPFTRGEAFLRSQRITRRGPPKKEKTRTAKKKDEGGQDNLILPVTDGKKRKKPIRRTFKEERRFAGGGGNECNPGRKDFFRGGGGCGSG